MNEYISRDAAISKIRDQGVLGGDYDAYEREEDVVDMLNSIPAADMVEVVRCRDCKHSLGYKFPYNYERVLACNDPHGMTIKAVNPMHFCSYGERKNGGQNE